VYLLQSSGRTNVFLRVTCRDGRVLCNLQKDDVTDEYQSGSGQVQHFEEFLETSKYFEIQIGRFKFFYPSIPFKEG
jgi:hypothetical protein